VTLKPGATEPLPRWRQNRDALIELRTNSTLPRFSRITRNPETTLVWMTGAD
jgi:hypothetical protein